MAKGRVIVMGFDTVWMRSRQFGGTGGVYRGRLCMEEGLFLGSDGRPITDRNQIALLPSPWREFALEQAIAPKRGTIVYNDGTPTLYLDVTVQTDIGSARLVDVDAPPEWSELLHQLEPDKAVGPVRAEISRTVKDGKPALEIILADIDTPVMLQDQRCEYVRLSYSKSERKQAAVTMRLGDGSR